MSRRDRDSQTLFEQLRRSPVVGGIAVLVILFSISRFYCGTSGGTLPKYDYACDNGSCRFSGRLPATRGVKLPAACPKCGQPTLHMAMKCLGCGKITPILNPWRDFTCTGCGHHEKARLDPISAPHECPSCKAKAFCQTFKCGNCRKVFGKIPVKREKPEMMAMLGPYDIAKCPDCGEMTADSLSATAVSTCVFCESDKLQQVTPSAVMSWEMGRKLKPEDQRKVDEWLAEQKKKK